MESGVSQYLQLVLFYFPCYDSHINTRLQSHCDNLSRKEDTKWWQPSTRCASPYRQAVSSFNTWLLHPHSTVGPNLTDVSRGTSTTTFHNKTVHYQLYWPGPYSYYKISLFIHGLLQTVWQKSTNHLNSNRNVPSSHIFRTDQFMSSVFYKVWQENLGSFQHITSSADPIIMNRIFISYKD